MAENSKIEWTDHTFNPWRGCTKIAPGCTNCYAARDSVRFPHLRGVWGDAGTRIRAADFRAPEIWNRKAMKAGERRRVFCASLADVFEDWQGQIHDHEGKRLKVPFQSGAADMTINDLRRDLFAMIDATPWLDWLLLTKRPENILRMWPGSNVVHDETAGPRHERWIPKYRDNAWLLTSVSEQETADRNIPELLKCRDLCPVLGVSYEPALGPVDFEHLHYDGMVEINCLTGEHGVYRPHRGEGPAIDWVIVGGESGPGARPFNIGWARSTIEQCRAADVACFVKQLGSNPHRDKPYQGMIEYPYSKGKGGDPKDWPDDLRVRQFPEAAVSV